MDKSPDERASLLIATGHVSAVVVLGHFGNHGDSTTAHGQLSPIERLVFDDRCLDTGTIDGFVAWRAAGGTKEANLAAASDRPATAATVDLERRLAPPAG